MKFKVGDKVKIREDLIANQTYDGLSAVDSMMDYKGQLVLIAKVNKDYYLINADDEEWAWTDEMFECEPPKTRGFELVKNKKNATDAILPLRGSKHAIAYDIYCPIDVTIAPCKSAMIWTDIKAYFQPGEALLINVRSSMGSHPVMLANSQGWVECDYYNNPKNEGNLGVNLLNLNTDEPYTIKRGDRIAQAMFIPFLVSDNCNSEEERVGGFGSTGK